MKNKINFGLFSFLVIILMGSCFGLNMDITLNQNGSGTITLEYQISKSLDSLGKLDGNEKWNTIPLGKADFERTIDRLPDIKMLSFSTKENEKNIVIQTKLEFSSLNGLLAFLDASGKHSELSGNARSGRLLLTLNEGVNLTNPALEKLIADISETYQVKMSMSFPGEGSIAIKDQKGTLLSAGKDIIAKGKKVSCAFTLAEVLSSSDGIIVEFSW